jgi:hypothetical protein
LEGVTRPEDDIVIHRTLTCIDSSGQEDEMRFGLEAPEWVSCVLVMGQT